MSQRRSFALWSLAVSTLITAVPASATPLTDDAEPPADALEAEVEPEVEPEVELAGSEQREPERDPVIADPPFEPTAAEAPREAPPVEARGGIQLSTADGTYRMQLGGYAQGPYAATLRDGELTPGGFSIRRIRWIKQGQLDDTLSYRFMIDIGGGPLLFDAYADWKLPAGAFVRVGRDKVPITRTFLTPAAQLSFAERALVADAHRWGRDLAVQLYWASDRASGNLGVGNGAVEGAPDKVPAVFARAQVGAVGKVFGPVVHAGDVQAGDSLRVTVGAAGIVDTARPTSIGSIAVDLDPDGDGDPSRVLVVAGSVDVTARYRGLELATEVIVRREDWRDILATNPDLAAAVGAGARRTYLSGMGELTYMVVPRHLLAGVRLAHGDLPFLSMRGASALPRGADVTEASTVVLLYRNGRRILGATYSVLSFGDAYNGGSRGGIEHRMIVETQLNL
jgi:hypothetical protein